MYTTVSTRKLSDYLQTRESMRVKCSGYLELNDVAACGKSVGLTKPLCDVDKKFHIKIHILWCVNIENY